MLYDLRYAARSLAKNPSFTVVVVLILALGIGANTAIFSLINAVLIRPLGFRQPDRLVTLHEGLTGSGFNRLPFSAPDLRDLENSQQSFQGVGAFRSMRFELSGDGDPEPIVGAKITASLFPLLGVEPALGRSISASEDRPGGDVVVLGWELWQRRYAGSPDIIGKAVLLDRRPYTVIGVMPASFQFPRRGPQFNNQPADVWVPMAFTEREIMRRGTSFNISVIARLKDNVPLASARSELDVLVGQISANYPPVFRSAGSERLRLWVQPFHEEIAGQIETPLLMLFGAVGLVLLVACANVANLILSRTARREREIGVRAALGATRGRLLRLQLSEALLLTVTGGALGIIIARWAPDAVPRVVADRLPGLEAVRWDLRVLAFTGGLSIATAVLFGLIPLVATERRDPSEILRENAARTTTGRRHRMQRGLIVSTVGLSFVLLVGAGLFLRSFTALISTDPGFRPGQVLTMSLALPREAYPTAASVRSFHRSLHERVVALPGVRSAALTIDLPPAAADSSPFTTEEGMSVKELISRTALLDHVHGPYFQTLGMSLKRGRFFSDDEHTQDRQVVIVNERLANRLWPGQDPIGKRLKWGLSADNNPNPWLTIVGVVGDVRVAGTFGALVGDDRPNRAYVPFRQFPDPILDNPVTPFGRFVSLIILAQGDPTPLAAPVRRELASLDPQLAVARIALMNERLGDIVAPQRFSTALVTAFAGGALLLVAIGLYGLLAFTVAERTREIGVRMALGADRSTVVRMVVSQGLKMVGAGLALGLAASLGATRLLSSFLYRVDRYDLATFVAVPLVLGLVALLACGLPAHRASRIDPLVALRYE